MLPTSIPASPIRLVRRLALFGVAMLLVLASCGREPTGPSASNTRIARGLSFTPVFPSMSLSGNAADLIAFSSVHVLLRRTDGSIAIDTTIAFPADSASITISLSVKLSPTAPPTGEPLALDLGYLNSQGAVVFKGSATIVAMADTPGGAPPPPVTVHVDYAGPGASAKSVRISPRSLTVNTGQTFSFTAVGLDASGAVVPSTPIVWTTLDPTRVQLPNNLDGSGTA